MGLILNTSRNATDWIVTENIGRMTGLR